MQHINQDRYPLGRPDTPPYKKFVEKSRARLALDGALAVPEFIRPDTVRMMVSEVVRQKKLGHRMTGEFTAYSDNLSEKDDNRLPAEHPRRARLPASHQFIAGDYLDPTSPLRSIYNDATFQGFITEILELPELYPVADPMGCLNYLIYEAGDCNGWHFDSTDFIVSIYLQAPEQGGDYQYLPDFRSRNDENLVAVSDRMRNPENPEGVKSATLTPGTLFLFKGRNTLHRVTSIQGSTDRVVAILSYHQQPGHQLSAGSRLAMYGRTESTT